MSRSASLLCVLVVALALGPLQALPARAAGGGMSAAFARTWARTDRPVAEGQANRTWMWGPGPFSNVLFEQYDEGSMRGFRVVQYFDKTRMEITDTEADPVNPWYVTNGLLAKELITGQLQLGHNSFWQGPPALVNVAGDPNDPNGPTYATFNTLMGHQPLPLGWTIIQTVDRAGNVGANQSLASFGVTAATFVPETNHTVASVFWEFMQSEGLIYQDGGFRNGRLFENPFYATGYPLTEAYWTTVLVGGVPKLVLVQVFERRVLTYTPDNPPGWQVEAGNVGQHYYAWRYGLLGDEPLTWTALGGPYAEIRPEELPYIDVLFLSIWQLQVGLQPLTFLLDHPDRDNPQWRADVETRLIFMQDAVRALREVSPPPRLGSAHSEVLAALNYFDRASSELRQYLATGDGTLERAAYFDVLQGLAALDELGLLAARGTKPALGRTQALRSVS
ncbi:peptidase domain-containing protein [Thermomicrobiaceae bacterium CFH 74404]|uniref:Peptidase domain-containing protein n=1 Tax=Thermalbibacter longus TaxID=2951981 RepID=A0AA42B900_9BACT|nr:peptidase domain-containing protein [Thermalbibacter longus]MCM8747616.1 peptidase domain-containing protein [Thermalbibacter longus]